MLRSHSILPSSGATTLVERVAKQDGVRRIASLIAEPGQHVHITGLRGSSPVLVVESLRQSLGRPVVVCCTDEEAARDAASDLGTISTARIDVFPEKDIFPQPFEHKENLTVRGGRNACLDRISRDEVDIVVTSLPGFLGKTIPAAALSERARVCSVGERLDREELIEHLVSVGYEGVQAIDELGQFAVRGSIIDIFDPSWEHPVRLELSDDELVSIRVFDIDSQRSVDKKESVRVLPATGVMVDEDTLTSLGNHLRERGVAEKTAGDIVQEIEHHRFSYLLGRYAPAMGMTGTLLDYFATPPMIFFWDESGIAEARETLDIEFEKFRKTSGEYPLLSIDDYILATDFYRSYEVSCVHLWSLPAQVARAAGAPATGATVAPGEERERPRKMITFQTGEHPSVMGRIDSLVILIRRLRHKGVDVLVFSDSETQRERFADLLEDDEQHVHLPVGWVTSGFVWEQAGIAVFTDHEIFHRLLPRPTQRRKVRRTQRYSHDHLQAGDFVVHVDYGIGRYIGLEKIAVDRGETECLSLRYQGNDRIFVPVDQMPFVEKYVGKEGVVPTLDRLGSSKWQRTKAKTKKALEEVARDMIRVHAEREIAERRPFGPDTHWQKELEASFPFEETTHQLRAAREIKSDMESAKPMDRLVCGDVGFGKTEVAIRAAFKAVNEGRQAAVLVPTTVLALQHHRTFSERMAPFPVRVEMLSRFRTTAQQKAIVEDLKTGVVDIVIGTHRLLSKDVEFKDIGLLIVDEEHRFGVRNKEKIKAMKKSVDVLAMTATPIPRTLYMALSGLRPISVIDTPPRNRHAVRTEVTIFDEGTIADAISREVARGGQVFFLHNRVASIYSMQAFLERLLPDVRFGVGHGQMSERELEKTIVAFVDKEIDVLVSTTIIESGLDFPNVNTIIINRADRFGLADLYQLRGRVGRRERQAFAYMLVPRNFSVTESASRRLQAMEEFIELGSGYRLAMRDLEIRGAGNILGVEQHGQLVAVGFDLYCKMLKEAVESLQGRQKTDQPQCRIETRWRTFLPDSYVEDQNERMALYRRLARIEDPGDIDELEDELIDRFGSPPAEAIKLLGLTRIKLKATALGVALIQFKTGRIVIEFQPGKALGPELCASLVETFEGRVLFKSGATFGLTLTHGGSTDWLDEAGKLLSVAWMYGNGEDSDARRPT
jgi:transcription-repair coupling factor (superfamily II helicase)